MSNFLPLPSCTGLQAPFMTQSGTEADAEAANDFATALNYCYVRSHDVARWVISGSSTLTPHTYISRTRSCDDWLWDNVRFVQLGVPLPRKAALSVAKATIDARSRRTAGGNTWTAEAGGKRVVTPAAVVRALSAKQPLLTAASTTAATKRRPDTLPYSGLIAAAVERISCAGRNGGMADLAASPGPIAAGPAAVSSGTCATAATPTTRLAQPVKAAADAAVHDLLRSVREASLRDVAVGCGRLYSNDRLAVRYFSTPGRCSPAKRWHLFTFYGGERLLDAISVPRPSGGRIGSGARICSEDPITLLPPFAAALKALVSNDGWLLLCWSQTGPSGDSDWQWGKELADTLHFFSDGRFFQRRGEAQKISAAVLAALAKAVGATVTATVPATASVTSTATAAASASATATPHAPSALPALDGKAAAVGASEAAVPRSVKSGKRATRAIVESLTLAGWAALPAVQALLQALKGEATPGPSRAPAAPAATAMTAGGAQRRSAAAALRVSCAQEFEQHLAAEAAARTAGLPVPDATTAYLQQLGFHMLRWLWAADANAFIPSRDTPVTRAGMNFCVVHHMTEAAIEALCKHWKPVGHGHVALAYDDSGVPALPRVARSYYSKEQLADPEFAAALEMRLRKSPW